MTPENSDERLAGHASTVHRVSWVGDSRVEALLEMGDCLVGLEPGRTTCGSALPRTM